MNYIELMKELVNKLISNNLADPEKIKGCTKEEIERIEKYYGFLLPESYKAFLTVMGHYCGKLYQGSDFLYNELFKVLDGTDPAFCAIEYMKELNVKPPESNIFVYIMHQGYQFTFFLFNDENDPPIYIFIGEENAKIKGGHITFTEYLKYEVDSTIEFYKNRKK